MLIILDGRKQLKEWLEKVSSERRKTELFNGYIEQVGDLYKGMDLKKYY